MSDTLAADIAVVIDRYATEQTRTNFMEVDKFARTYFNFDLTWQPDGIIDPDNINPGATYAEETLKSGWPTDSTIHLPMIFILILM